MKYFYTFICLLVIMSGFLSKVSVYADTEPNREFSSRLISDFSLVLERRGWFTDQDGPDLAAWTFTPSYRKISIRITESAVNDDSAVFSINSSKDNTSSEKTFSFTKDSFYSYEKVRSLSLPYLLSLTNTNADDNQPEQYFTSFAFGYYRINEDADIKPEKNKGVYLLNWKFAYDPTRNISSGTTPLYVADFIDSSYSVSIDPDGSEILGKLDETAINIDVIIYGKSKAGAYKNGRSRQVYGLFNTIEYYRPYLMKDKMLWNEDIYTDHMHIQYCYWEALAFRHDILLSRNGKDLFFSYKIGAGPGQNSSLTATNITEAEELHLNKIFMSNWYGLNEHGNRRHNYYYSMTFPLRLEFTADKYLNSKLELKYYFYYFQALMDTKAYDFLNRTVVRYGYYITENITAGAAYEFWHVKSRENENRKSHHWHRLNIQMEIKI